MINYVSFINNGQFVVFEVHSGKIQIRDNNFFEIGETFESFSSNKTQEEIGANEFLDFELFWDFVYAKNEVNFNVHHQIALKYIESANLLPDNLDDRYVKHFYLHRKSHRSENLWNDETNESLTKFVTELYKIDFKLWKEKKIVPITLGISSDTFLKIVLKFIFKNTGSNEGPILNRIPSPGARQPIEPYLLLDLGKKDFSLIYYNLLTDEFDKLGRTTINIAKFRNNGENGAFLVLSYNFQKMLPKYKYAEISTTLFHGAGHIINKIISLSEIFNFNVQFRYPDHDEINKLNENLHKKDTFLCLLQVFPNLMT